ncbi:MAG TPA: hypothetical protein VMX74_15775 [Pirellulales bacterium]|nr:hypothetical protein [Pirellulales bacterium]
MLSEEPSTNRPLRVLHCPTMTGGNPQELARAERTIGLASWSVALFRSTVGYETDEVIDPHQVGPLRMEMARWPLLWRALRDFDVIHFNFGSSLMPHWNSIHSPAFKNFPVWKRRLYGIYARCLELKDLPVLKLAGKGIVVTYQGDDARQGDYCRNNYDITFAGEVEPGYYSSQSDRRKRRRIERFARYADRIYAVNPDLLNNLPERAEFLPYACINLTEWSSTRSYVANDPPVVLHAPSNRDVKGTRYVTEAVARLQAEGIAFEFVLVEDVARADLRSTYEKADLLVDQVLAGWYGGLAVELMALGKPVMCYIRDSDLHFIPPAMREQLPVISVTPDTLYARLKEWLTTRRSDLSVVGERSRQFVEQWHDPLKIANQLKDDYEAIIRSKSGNSAG